MIERPTSSKQHHLSAKERKLYANQDPTMGPIMLVRRLDWQARFSQFITESMQEGIKCDWEFNHCAGWCAMGVEEITGYDFFVPFKDYPIEDAASAYKAVKHAGYDSLDQYIELHFVEKPLAFTSKGDLVMVPATGGDFEGLGMSMALGLAEPPYVWALTKYGVGRVDLFDCSRAFAVGSLG